MLFEIQSHIAFWIKLRRAKIKYFPYLEQNPKKNPLNQRQT